MKNITRKIVALLASAVTTVTTLSANYSEVFAETTQETAVSSADSDYEVKSGGLFGTFLSDEMNETVSGEQEKQSADYAVYKLVYNSDTGSFVADYKAVSDCTLFIGFYNDEGTVLYTSIKKEIEASPNGQTEITVDVLLPENYLVKAFVIGANQEPLCKPKVYDKFTKAMQEILAKTTEDFEKDKVINLDENNENNFVVMNDGVIEITSSETVDTFVKTDDNGRHIFENAVEIAKLEKGSKAIVYTDYTIIAFVVGDIIMDGSMVTIVPSDADISEVFSFIKIDDSKYGKESKFLVDESNENNPNDVVYLGDESQEASAERKNAPGMPINTRPQNKDEWEGTVELPNLSTTIPFALLKEDYFGNNEKSKNVIRDHEADVAATLSFGISVDLEIYYDVRIFGPKYVSITGTADISVEVSINCGIHKEWRLMPITIFTVGVASISIIPNVKLGAEAGATFSYTRTYDVNINSFTGPDWQSRDPIISKIEGKVTVDITFGLKIAVLIVGYDVFAIDLDAGVRLEVSTDYFESHTEYMKHQCKNCVGFSISFIFDISLTIDLFSLEDWTWDLLEVEIPLGKWYCSSDIGWGKNECPNKYHQVCVTIKDKKTKKPIKGVKLYAGYQALPDYLIKLDNGQANVSDSDGKIKFWVKDSEVSNNVNYCVTALTDNKDRGYCVIGKEFDRESRKLQNYTIYIKTKSSGSDKDEEVDTEAGNATGSSYILSGECGNYLTDEETGEKIYDDVTYYYYPDGDCIVSGNGTIDSNALFDDLIENDIKEINNLIISNGVSFNKVNDKIRMHIPDGFTINTIKVHNYSDDTFIKLFTSKWGRKVDLSDTSYKKIGEESFHWGEQLEEIIYPEGLEEIGDEAFAWTSLTEFIAPQTLKKIGGDAFYGCLKMKNVVLNEGLELIAGGAFHQTIIESINIPSSVKYVYGSALFSGHLKKVIINGDFITQSDCSPFRFENEDFSAPIETIIINDGVTVLGDDLFYDLQKLKKIRFSQNLKKIGNKTFFKYPLTNIDLPKSLTCIGDQAFAYSKLTSVNLPENLESIGKEAFMESNLTSVVIPESVKEIGENAFGDYKGYTIPREPRGILKDITLLNPDCILGKGIVEKDVTIYGYTGSTAEKYAKGNGNPFKALDAPGVTTTTKATTTTTITTTTAAVVTTQVAPDSECVFIAVKDKDTAGASSDKVFADGNVKYFDQQTADANGVVSFSYLPDEKEKWAFIFVSQVINDTITKTFGTADDLKTTTYNVAPGVKGDANGDGEIDMSDVVLIMQALANPNKYGIEGTDPKHISENGFKYADSDGDGLTVNDALRIQQYLLGIIPSLT